MLIEYLLECDSAGEFIPMGNEVYHFAPDGTGRNVCEVNFRSHIARFMSIPEGYRPADGIDEPEAMTSIGAKRPVFVDAGSVIEIDQKQGVKPKRRTRRKRNANGELE